MGHLPKEVRAAAITKIGSVYVNRQPLKGIEGEEAKKILNIIDESDNQENSNQNYITDLDSDTD